VQCNLGLSEYVLLPSKELGLGFFRINKDWRLVAILGLDGDGDPSDVKAWSDCGRATKLATVALLPVLLERLAAMAEAQAAHAEATLAAIPDVEAIPF